MKKILEELGSILEDAKKMKSDYEKKFFSLASLSDSLESRTADVVTREAAIREKESSFSRMEYTEKTRAEAEALLQNARERIAEAVSSEERLRKSIAEQMDNLASVRSSVAAESANLEKHKKSFEDEVSKRVSEVIKTLGIKRG